MLLRIHAGLLICLVITACMEPDADESALSPSCSAMTETCGPDGTSPCCDSALVPGGPFHRSYDVGTDALFQYALWLWPATVSDFQLDTYEVTVGRFREFVNAGTSTQTNPPMTGAGGRTLNGMADQGGWDPTWNASLTADADALVAAVKCNATYQTWTDTSGANENLPMNCITWYEAMAFCTWDGGFLPTEAEWNYAAAGGAEQRAYPWSNPPSSVTIDCSHANYFDNIAYCASHPKGALNRVGSESPDGDGRWRQADLGGNVSEWTFDQYDDPYVLPCDDCAAMTSTGALSIRMVRGGRFDYVATLLRGAQRDGAIPDSRNDGIGARCARFP
jgi:formylglycine-generating enzyme required for sulfatase activity